MCGLFGWVGKDPKDFNKDKFDKLGMFNIERGKHSCGVTVDGELYKGVNKTSNYVDFLIEENFPSPVDIPVVIGHTRHATRGRHTIENAHPFKFEKEEGFVVGAHNGTINNTTELADKYGITEGIKIDSEVLLEIISNGNEEVLQDYKGAAALLIYSSAKPDTLYLFRGESEEYYSSVSSKPERPLFYYKESETSMYISSLEDSLKAITNTKQEKDEIFEVQTNRIYEIKAGKIINKYIVDRSNVWKTLRDYVKKNEDKENIQEKQGHNCSVKTNNTNRKSHNYPSNKIDSEKENNIYFEKVIFTNLEQDIYYENLRYKRNGHLVTGVCIFIKELGFISISKDVTNIDSILKGYKFYDRSIGESIELGDLSKIKLYYIYNGILLKSEKDFKAMGGFWNQANYTDISHMSEYPIINYEENKKKKINYKDQNILLENSLYSGLLEPLGSNSEYEIKNGLLISKTELDDIITPENDDCVSLYESIGNMEDEEDDDDTFDNNLKSEILSITNDEMMDSLIEVSTQFNEAIVSSIQLEKYKGQNSIVDSLIEFSSNTENSFEPISKTMKELIDVNIKNEE